MEASALQHSARAPFVAGLSPHLRLQRDEKLIALIRRGHQGAFEALVRRYESRLLGFCRHMLGSAEDAEDVLQEVFASAYTAIRADDRPIAARPWLYRIARNRCLNHLRSPRPVSQETMDDFERDGGTTTADAVQQREELRLIVADVQELPETQRSALLLREIEALSYDQIAQAMDTTIPAVKSLLVRARVSLAEAAEARALSCAEVRVELGRIEEGLAKSNPLLRRHLKSCERCRSFRTELRRTSRALAAVFPVAPLVMLKNVLGLKGGAFGGGAAGGAGAGGGAMGAVGGAITPIATKGAAGLVAAAIVTAGAVEVDHLQRNRDGGSDRSGARAEPAHRAPAERGDIRRVAARDTGAAAAERARREADREAETLAAVDAIRRDERDPRTAAVGFRDERRDAAKEHEDKAATEAAVNEETGEEAIPGALEGAPGVEPGGGSSTQSPPKSSGSQPPPGQAQQPQQQQPQQQAPSQQQPSSGAGASGSQTTPSPSKPSTHMDERESHRVLDFVKR